MSVSFGGLSAGLRGVKTYERAFERAAERVTAATTSKTAAVAEDPVVQLPNALAEMIVAQRMHTAAMRVVETAHEMLREVVELPE